MPGPLKYNDGWCAKCGDAPRGSHVAYCRVCWNEYQSAYRKRRYATEPEYRRKLKQSFLERRYGLTEDQYTFMWAAQGGVCVICLTETGKKGLVVDHDHETGAVRALLCANCNGAIGMLQEKPHIFQRAAEYVENQ